MKKKNNLELSIENHCQLRVESDKKEAIMEAIINIQTMKVDSIFLYDSKLVHKSLSKMDGLIERKDIKKENLKTIIGFIAKSKNRKIMVMDMKQEKGILKMYKTFLPNDLVLGILKNIK